MTERLSGRASKAAAPALHGARGDAVQGKETRDNGREQGKRVGKRAEGNILGSEIRK